MPKGVNFPHGLKSWSAPRVPRRLLPPRENGPIRTGALASQERRRVSSERAAYRCTSVKFRKMASVSFTLFGADS